MRAFYRRFALFMVRLPWSDWAAHLLPLTRLCLWACADEEGLDLFGPFCPFFWGTLVTIAVAVAVAVVVGNVVSLSLFFLVVVVGRLIPLGMCFSLSFFLLLLFLLFFSKPPPPRLTPFFEVSSFFLTS